MPLYYYYDNQLLLITEINYECFDKGKVRIIVKSTATLTNGVIVTLTKEELSRSICVSDILKYNLCFDWDIEIFSLSNKTLTIDFLKKYPNGLLGSNQAPIPWNWYYLSANSALPIKEILCNIQLGFIPLAICMHPELTLELGLEHGLDLNYICINSYAVTPIVLRRYPNLPWNYEYLSHNRSIDFHTLLRYRDKPWNFEYLHDNPMTQTRARYLSRKYYLRWWNRVILPRRIHECCMTELLLHRNSSTNKLPFI